MKYVIEVAAEWTGENGERLCEALYGLSVTPGTAPVDLLIKAVERAYLDWDITDPKFQELAKKVLGKVPDNREWAVFINQSSQSDELKDKLLQMSGAAAGTPDVTAGAPAPQAGGGSGTLVTKRGVKINYSKLIDKGPYYVVLIPTAAKTRILHHRPRVKYPVGTATSVWPHPNSPPAGQRGAFGGFSITSNTKVITIRKSSVQSV